MARPLRIEYEGAWYHVTCRGNEQVPIFRSNHDRERFMDTLAQSAEEYQVQVYGYCLMLNHFHLLVTTLLANLSRFMQRFNTSYTVYFNKKHQRVGHLYQGRYKALLVDADSYLLELSRYLHLNPVRLKKNKGLPYEEKVKILEEYPWSSYRAYVGKEKSDLLHREVLLDMFGGKEKQRERRYKEYLLKGLRYGVRNPMEEQKGGILGEEEFCRWVYKKYVEGKEEEKEYTGIVELRPQIEIETIVREVAEEFGMRPEELYERYTRSIARQVAIELGCRYAIGVHSLSEVAEKFGMGRGGVSMNRKRLQKRVAGNPELKRRIERIAKRVEGKSR